MEGALECGCISALYSVVSGVEQEMMCLSKASCNEW